MARWPFLSILAIALSALPLGAQGPVTAFVNVSVIPMDSERVLPAQTVLVRGNRIIALGAVGKVAIPKAATRIEGAGKFLIPGLADMHAHIPDFGRLSRWMFTGESPFDSGGIATSEQMLFLYLANGVTTVRVMYGKPETLALRDRAATGNLLSPRIYTATAPLYDRDHHRPPVRPVILVSPADAVDFVDSAKKAGYDFIKMYGLSGELLDTVAAEAHRVGLPIAGHAPLSAHSLEDAIRVGYRSIEHLTGFPQYFTGAADAFIENWPATLDTMKLRTLATRLQQAGIWNCPTELLAEMDFIDPDSVMAWPEWRYFTAEGRERIAKRLRENRGTTKAGLRTITAQQSIIKALADAGAGLLLGTDAITNGVVPGFSISRELEALVRAGLTPYAALATGTRNVAAYFGTSDSTGTIAVGKRADLVLLTGNPLTNIRYTTNPAGVMLGGRWLSRAELDRRLAALEGKIDY